MSQTEINSIRDKLLLMRAQAREPGAFQELVEQYERRILYYVHRILGDDTDRADVLQEIWIRVFLRINTLRAPEAFRAWLYKIAHDVAVTQLRKRSRRETAGFTDEDVGDPVDTDDWNELELLDRAELVHGALAKLSLPHREVLTLRFLEELDLAEIAHVVGCRVGTVKSRLHYAKAEIRKLLEGDDRD